MRLCTNQFNNLGSDGLHLANRQLPGAVKDDFGIRREQAVWTHVAIPTKVLPLQNRFVRGEY